MSGSQAAAYDSGSGGYGYTCSTVLRFNKGDTITVSTPNKPNDTGTSPSGGKKATIKKNGSLILVAGGGAASISRTHATAGVNSITTGGGEGYTNGSNGYATVHWCPNKTTTIYTTSAPTECYSWSTHNAKHHTHHKPDGVTCPSHQTTCTHSCWVHDSTPRDDCGTILTKCSIGHIRPNGPSATTCGEHYTEYTCGSPANTQTYTPTGHDGEIRSSSNAQPGSNYGFSTPGSLTNAGHAKCTIRLAEQYENVSGKNDGMTYSGAYVKYPQYNDRPCYLILKDDTVAYFKRP